MKNEELKMTFIALIFNHIALKTAAPLVKVLLFHDKKKQKSRLYKKWLKIETAIPLTTQATRLRGLFFNLVFSLKILR